MSLQIDDKDLQQRLELALRVMDEASALILNYYNDAGLEIETKSDESPVTIADRSAEQLIRQAVDNAFPQDGVLGEEFGETASSNGFRWILDPIDGTKPFIHGVPLFGSLIGVERDGEMVIGVCGFPPSRKWSMQRRTRGHGGSGEREPVQTHVKQTADLSQAMFCFTDLKGWHTIGKAATFERLRQTCRLTRGWGDCYGHAMVATGRADLMVDPLMSPWDAAALVPILQEAGGHFLSWEGVPTHTGGNGFSTNPLLKDTVLEILKSS